MKFKNVLFGLGFASVLLLAGQNTVFAEESENFRDDDNVNIYTCDIEYEVESEDSDIIFFTTSNNGKWIQNKTGWWYQYTDGIVAQLSRQKSEIFIMN